MSQERESYMRRQAEDHDIIRMRQPRPKSTQAVSDMTICGYCGTWRSKPCGEGCYWGIRGDGHGSFTMERS